ncbi:MAG: choice-of-anchor S family protein [Candidatus Heimdallarchaeota archaeon]
MKRTINPLIICTIILLGSMNSYFAQANFTLNDSFIFEITDTNLYVEIGENEYKKEGFLFSGDYYSDHTLVNATIDYFYNGGIMFEFYIDNSSNLGYVSPNWLDILGISFSYYTLYYTYLMVENWGNGFWLDLTLYQIKPYIEPIYGDYINDLDSLGSEICEFFSQWWYKYPDIECDYIFTESNGIYYFESWVGGIIDALFGNDITDGTDFPTVIKFGNSMHLAVNKTSGLMHGFGRRGWVKGEINNQQVKSSMACEYVLDGYEFQKYQLGRMRYFGEDQYFLAVFLPISILVISIPVIVYFVRKSKFDKLLKQNE